MAATPAAGALVALWLLALSSLAAAETTVSDWDGAFDAEPATIRSDLHVGLSAAPFVGNASGWLNRASDLGRADREQSTNIGVGTSGALYVGVALKDYMNFALSFASLGLSGNDRVATGGAFLVRIEAFPLYARGGLFEGAGISGNFGVGFMDMERGSELVAEGGALSALGLGLFHESLRFSGFTFGPEAQFFYLYSQSMDVTAGSLGIRVAYYSGP
jgi:hypothetical protein